MENTKPINRERGLFCQIIFSALYDLALSQRAWVKSVCSRRSNLIRSYAERWIFQSESDEFDCAISFVDCCDLANIDREMIKNIAQKIINGDLQLRLNGRGNVIIERGTIRNGCASKRIHKPSKANRTEG